MPQPKQGLIALIIECVHQAGLCGSKARPSLPWNQVHPRTAYSCRRRTETAAAEIAEVELAAGPGALMRQLEALERVNGVRGCPFL